MVIVTDAMYRDRATGFDSADADSKGLSSAATEAAKIIAKEVRPGS
jgi:hypothetical protein